MTLASTLVARARLTLIDASSTTWTDSELLGYLNAGIAEACGLVLDAYVVVGSIALSAGVRQTLPAGALMLVDVVRNASGGAVTQEALSELARTRPTWAGDTAGPTRYFMYDRRSPLTFLVYPPAASGNLELVYGAVPSAITASDQIPISAAYDTALWAFVVSMALAKNSKKQDLDKAKQFMGMFTSALDAMFKARAANTSIPDPKGER